MRLVSKLGDDERCLRRCDFDTRAALDKEFPFMNALRRPATPAITPTITVLPTTSQDVLDDIRDAYMFEDATDEAAALEILEKRPDVAAVLLEALPHIRDVFGKSACVKLLSVDDPTDASIRLSARIVTNEPIPAARAKRDAFYRAFWIRVPGEIDAVLSFGLLWPRTV